MNQKRSPHLAKVESNRLILQGCICRRFHESTQGF